jgi:flagellar hook protein FlgE
MPFRTALSGLNAASSELRVIGNNVANASTVGFKESRTEFSDIFPASNLGVAANAIGTGVKVGSVSQQFSQGNINFTDNNLDLAISGQGFFRLNDNGVTVYSRAGQFGVDREGYVVNSQGQRLTAYTADGSGNITGAIGDMRLDTSDLAPQQSGSVEIMANLDSTVGTLPAAGFDVNDPSSYHNTTSYTVYDSLGNPRLITNYFLRTADGEWAMYAYEGGAQIDADAGSPDDFRTLTFDNFGSLTSPAVVTTGTIAAAGGAAAFALDINLAGTSQYGSGFSINRIVQDGYATGRLSGIDIGETGVVTARYTNGQSRTIAQVALATFGNPQGLRQQGDTTWSETYDSGAALVGAPGSGALGLVQSGALEGSNVDLTEQLVNMITAQRNFQANAQVITTADTITQTIINIR